MGWLDKLFGKKENENNAATAQVSFAAPSVAKPFEGLGSIRFGRYSDNNKSYKKTQSWYAAEERFKEKNYTESIALVFDYLRDDIEDNVRFTPDGKKFSFNLIQGSKRVHGECDGENISGYVSMAVMDKPITAVMRRVLELNYSLYYTHCAMDENNTLCMIFNSDVPSANPSKIYYGLRELATKADRQDDLLLADFPTLKPADTDHIQQLPEHELNVKYEYFCRWITETLEKADALNQDSFSGAIAYLLLGVLYRIDFLITPEAKLLAEIEKISSLYWVKKEETPLIERNQLMKDALRKLLDTNIEIFRASVYRSRSSFSIATPPTVDKVKDNIINSNRDSQWYIDNKYPEIALNINEYGMLYNQFVYSMPRVQTDLITIYMGVMYSNYMTTLGMKHTMYNEEDKTFDRATIVAAIDEAIARYTDKYQQLKWDHSKINYTGLYEFGISYSEQMANLNLETKR